MLPAPSRVLLRVAVEDLDRDVLWAAQEGDADAGPHRGRLHGELGALALELSDRRVDALDPQADMLEPEIGRLRRRRGAVLGDDRRDEDRHAAEIEVDALAAIRLGRALDR